jgi:hypothetical protein
VRLPEHGARRNPDRHSARCAGGALERDRAVFQPVNVTLTARFSKKLNCATKTVDMKVVDETSSTTFAKVVLCFSRRFEQERQAKLGFCRVKTAVNQVFHPSPLKISNAIQHESCVPRKTGQLLYW